MSAQIEQVDTNTIARDLLCPPAFGYVLIEVSHFKKVFAIELRNCKSTFSNYYPSHCPSHARLVACAVVGCWNRKQYPLLEARGELNGSGNTVMWQSGFSLS